MPDDPTLTDLNLDPNVDPTPNPSPPVPPEPDPTPVPSPAEPPLDLNALADKLAEEKLKAIKVKLNEAYGKVEEQKAEVVRLTAELEDSQKKLIEKEGVHAKQLTDEKAILEKKVALLEQKLLNNERRAAVNSSIQGLNFVNPFAKDQAATWLETQIRQDETGHWVHSSGIALEEYVSKVLTNSETHSYWFDGPMNTGPTNDKSPAAGPASLSTEFDILDESGKLKISEDELMRMAREGRI